MTLEAAPNPSPNPPRAPTWQAEEFHFALHYAGRTAGNAHWVSGLERHHWVIRCETQFAGLLGGAQRVQVSKLEPSTGLSVGFAESDGSGGRAFETSFDRKTGLVTLRQGHDQASVALTQDYLDPLSLLQHLRGLAPEVSGLRLPMVGGNVLVTRLPDETVPAPWGESLARVYYLRPGLGLVHVEAEAPHRLLKLSQTFGKFMLEAVLMRVGVPDSAPSSHLAVQNERTQIRQTRHASDRSGPANRRPVARQALRKADANEEALGESQRLVSNVAPTENPNPGNLNSSKRKRRKRSRRGGQSADAQTGQAANTNQLPESSGNAAKAEAGPSRRRRRRFRRGNDGNSGGGNAGGGEQ